MKTCVTGKTFKNSLLGIVMCSLTLISSLSSCTEALSYEGDTSATEEDVARATSTTIWTLVDTYGSTTSSITLTTGSSTATGTWTVASGKTGIHYLTLKKAVTSSSVTTTTAYGASSANYILDDSTACTMKAASSYKLSYIIGQTGTYAITVATSTPTLTMKLSASSTSTIRGMDVSMLSAVEASGGTFYESTLTALGSTYDLFDIMKLKGVNLVRLRLWNNPYSTAGVSYGGGACNIAVVKALAVRAKKHGMKVLLNIHYSDFWCDPGKQFIPKAWTSYTTAATLATYVKSFTKSSVAALISAGAQPDYVQIGNEINGGMLWEIGKNWTSFTNLNTLLAAGIAGVKAAESAASVSTEAQIILHYAQTSTYPAATFAWWIAGISSSLDYDIVGFSYYPYWHGTQAALAANMETASSSYGKKTMVLETAYAWTLDNEDSCTNSFATSSDVSAGGYAATEAGQKAYLVALKKTISAISSNLGFVYWEPDWLPVGGSAVWATTEGMAYVSTSGTSGNGWENQALFDFSGNALSALSCFAE